MFEVLVLRPIEVPRGQQLLVFIEEPDRHVCGQCQRQSSRVSRDAREPGLGEAVGIDIDAGAGRRPRCDRRRNTQVNTPFSGRASGPGSWRETIPFPGMTHRSWQAGYLSTFHVLVNMESHDRFRAGRARLRSRSDGYRAGPPAAGHGAWTEAPTREEPCLKCMIRRALAPILHQLPTRLTVLGNTESHGCN